MASKRSKENIAEKLSALKPSVPTSTRAVKAKKKPTPKTGKEAGGAPPVAAAKKPAVPAKKPVVPAEKPAPPKAEPIRQDAPEKMASPAAVKSAFPGVEALGTHIEKSLRLPWMMFDVWRGVAQAYYGMAESQMKFLVNMTSWKIKL
jgi:hypothetical protein